MAATPILPLNVAYFRDKFERGFTEMIYVARRRRMAANIKRP